MRSGKITHSPAGAANMKKQFIGGGKKKEGETHNVTFDQPRYTHKNQSQWQPHFPQPYQAPYTPYPYVAATSQTPYPQPYPAPRPPPPPPQPQRPPAIPVRPSQQWAQNPNPNQNPRRPNNQERRQMQFDPIPMSYTELLPQLFKNSLLAPCPMKPVEPPFYKGYDLNAKCDYHAGAIGHSIENCHALKFRVQNLINAKWLNFKKNSPNIGSNPLPGHGGPSVSVVEEGEEQSLKKRIEDVKMPLKAIFHEMCKFGMIKGSLEEDVACGLHPEADHPIEECLEFK